MTALARLLSALGAAALLLLGCAAPGQPPAAPSAPASAGAATTATPGAAASPAEWPTGLLPAVAAALGAEAAWHARPTTTGAEARNARHGLSARFEAGGLHLVTAAGAVRLALAGTGRDGKLKAPARAKAEVEGARVLYRHDANLTQWFINSPLGLEQGFTLEQRPEGKGELQLALTLTGDLAPTLDNNELVFLDNSGAARLRYGALSAFDAEGRALPARMALEDRRLLLAVDDSKAHYPVVIDPLFSQVAKLTSGDAATMDQFGYSVALSGDTAIVGALNADLPGKSDAGAAYVFVRSGKAWIQQAKLTAADAAASDHFGVSVAIDGDTAVVGAHAALVGINAGAGAAYVFVRTGTAWSQQAKVFPVDGRVDDNFGVSVAIAGNTLLVGANRANLGSLNGDEGAAYVFVRAGTTWSQQRKLYAGDWWGGEWFGSSVALSGETALIGAPRESMGVGKSYAGAAYVFVRSGTSWSQQQKLTAADGVSLDFLGFSVALSGDTALLGARSSDPNGKSSAGAAYVFLRSGSTWVQEAKLTASDGAVIDWFGCSVALSGETALVGSRQADLAGVSNAGAAYVFVRSAGIWAQQSKLTAAGHLADDYFGDSVALSGDTAMIGAASADPGGNADAGAVYVYSPAVDLSLIKRDNADPVRPSDTFSYNLYVTNQDTEVDATGVNLTDTLPAGATYLSNGADCTVSGVELSCALGTLAKGGSMTSVNVTVRADAARGTLLTNTATVSADQPDIVLANNTDTETTLVNTTPVASPLTLAVIQGGFVSGTLPASDANGHALTYSLVANGTNGTAVITDATTGTFTYTANTGASGTDTFTFQVNDGLENSTTATVTVNIQNPAPVASGLALTTYAGTAVSGTLPASDPGGNALTFSIVTNSAKGTAVITDTATGAFTYTPHAGQTGADSFTFKAHDGTADSNTATISITINALPAPGNAAPLANGLALVAYESAVSGTLSASDANGDALTFAIVANGANGVAVITNAATGTFTYTPTAGQTGADSFTFQATDRHGAASNTAMATITIHALPTPGNVAPTAADLALIVYQGHAITGTLPASDANGDSLTFSLVADGAKGSAVITNSASGAFTYTANVDQSGTDTFTFQATDGRGIASNVATVSITINALPAPANAAPLASDFVLVVYAGNALSGRLPAADANGDALAFGLASMPTQGVAVITDPATGAFTYTANVDQSGTDTFTFQASDGALDSNTATVAITVLPLPAPGNAAPIASGASLIAYAGSPISGTLAAADANADTLTFTLVANGTQGTAVITDPATGAFTYTPTAGASGTDTFTFQASDGTLNSNTATVRITLLAAPASEQPTAQHTGGGGALSPLALLLGLAAAVRSRRRRQAAG